MAKQQSPILPARFQLNEEKLKEFTVSVLDFPFQSAIDRFISAIQMIRGKKLWYNEYPPYRTLNDVLLLLTPTLIHAFEKQWDANKDREISHPTLVTAMGRR
jgi:hypothetical protein